MFHQDDTTAESRMSPKKILVIRSVNVHETAHALQRLRTRFPDAEISLLVPRHLQEHLANNPVVDRFIVYENASAGRGWTRALDLIRDLRQEWYDEVIVLRPGQTRIDALYHILFFSLFIPAKRRIILDADMKEFDLSFRYWTKVFVHHCLLLFGSVCAVVMTLVLLAWNPDSKGRPVRRKQKAWRSGKVAVLVPILPDISHTFIYREVLAMKDYGAEFVVIALEEGDYTILHPEAQELLKLATFTPRLSLGRYMLCYLYFSLRFPRRMAELIRLYQPYTGKDPLLFLRLDQYHNSLHPMHGMTLAKMLTQLGVTSLHVHGSTYPTTRAMVASVLLDIPFSTHAFVDFDFEYDFKMLPEKLNHAAFFVTHTDFCQARLRTVGGDAPGMRFHTIRTGVNPSQWHMPPRHESPDGSRLVAVCRFVEKKGLDVLVRACALLKGRRVSFECLLIGDGPELARLQSLVAELQLQDEVRFTGAIPTDQVRSYFLSSNIIVVPSVYAKDGERDGIPTVLFEAMACGVPAVASAISGIPELIEHGVSGLLVPERDEERLASAIQLLLEDPELRERLRRNGRQKVLREFDVRLNAIRLWNIILREHYPDFTQDSMNAQ